jgi:hypothetical protein
MKIIPQKKIMTKSYPVYFNQWCNPLCKLQGSPPQKQILAPLELGESKVGKFGIFVTLFFYSKSTILMLMAYLIS